MGIDGIGSKGPPLPPPAPTATGGPARSGPTGSTFQVPKGGDAALVTPAAAAAPHSPLDRLRAGEIDLATYTNLKVDEATGHLSGLPASTLEGIRRALRERIASDPALVELVRTATGQVPAAIED
jgi:hypothetical protein